MPVTSPAGEAEAGANGGRRRSRLLLGATRSEEESELVFNDTISTRSHTLTRSLYIHHTHIKLTQPAAGRYAPPMAGVLGVYEGGGAGRIALPPPGLSVTGPGPGSAVSAREL